MSADTGNPGQAVTVTILGCGGSLGVPALGLGWGTVDPTEPRNRRLRPSILVEWGGERLLVDTSPDCREQLLTAGVTRLDRVLYTHEHADHVHGLDDLRPLTYARRSPIPAYADPLTQQALEGRFGYAVTTVDMDRGLYRPILELQPIQASLPVAGGVVESFTQAHGAGTSLGFRFGPIVYSTDVSDLAPQVLKALTGVPVWIVDACREEPHPSHAHLAKTLAWIAEVRPQLAILTHMNHTMDYGRLRQTLPAGVIPAYDGLRIQAEPGGPPRLLEREPVAAVAP